MATEQNQSMKLDFTPLAEYLRQSADRASLKSLLETVGVQQVVELIGEEQFWANLSPEQREKLRRLIQQDNPAPNEPTG